MLLEDRQAWLSHPATQDLMSRISVEYEGIKESWANGSYITHESQLEAVGSAKGLTIAIELIEAVGGPQDE